MPPPGDQPVSRDQALLLGLPALVGGASTTGATKGLASDEVAALRHYYVL